MTINSVFATFKLRLLAFNQQQRFFSSEFVSCSRSVRVEHTKMNFKVPVHIKRIFCHVQNTKKVRRVKCTNLLKWNHSLREIRFLYLLMRFFHPNVKRGRPLLYQYAPNSLNSFVILLKFLG